MPDHDVSEHSLPLAVPRWIFRRQIPIVALVALITLAAVYQLSQAKFGNSLLQTFMEDQSEYNRYVQRASALGGDSDDLIYIGVYEGADLFTPAKLNALRAAARELEKLPEVVRATTLVDAHRTIRQRLGTREIAARSVLRRRLLRGELPEQRFEPDLYWPQSHDRQREVDLEVLREEMLRDDAIAGAFVSRDGQAAALVLKLENARELTIQNQIGLPSKIEQIVRAHGLGVEGVYTAGLVISQSWLFREMQRGLTVLCPIVLVTVSATVYILFRRWAIVLLTAMIGVLATLWAVAATVYLFGEVSVLVAAVPLVILVISTSDLIHLTSTYRHELHLGLARREALECTVCEVGGACLLTCLTTVIGFASLATVAVPATRHFAVASAVGVVAALVLQTLVPIVYLRTAGPSMREEGTLHRVFNGGVEALVQACCRVSLRWPWTVIVCCVLTIGLAVAGGALNLRFSADFPARFPRRHPLPQGAAFFNEHFSGTTNLELFVEFGQRRLLDPASLRSLASFEEAVQSVPSVRAVHSVLQYYRAVDRLIDYRTPDRLPPSREAAEASLRLAQQYDAETVAIFVTPDRDLTRLFVQVSDTDFIDVAGLTSHIEEAARRTLPPDARLEVSGTFPIVGRTVNRIIDGQLRGNGICMVAVTAVMAFALGSLRIALLAQLPNFVPLAILVGAVMLLYPRVDSDMLGLPMVALGIAVDDTLHFLHRYRIQLAAGESRREALDSTFRYTGHAIVHSCLILCIGLLPCALSAYLGVWMLGTLLVFTLACGLIADLLLVPALVITGILDWRRK